jgi:hypothetical protein
MLIFKNDFKIIRLTINRCRLTKKFEKKFESAFICLMFLLNLKFEKYENKENDFYFGG